MSRMLSTKLLSLEQVAKLDGSIYALAAGTFDLFHYGHLRYLRSCAELAQRLCVGITEGRYIDKGPGRPVFKDDERIAMIDSLYIVDAVVLVPDQTMVPLIEALRPAVYCKGSETRRDGNMNLVREMTAVNQGGGMTVFVNKTVPYSSGKLLSGEFWPTTRYKEGVT